jgi:hypothetical protein
LLRQVLGAGQLGQRTRFPQLLTAVPVHRPRQKRAGGFGLQRCLRLWARARSRQAWRLAGSGSVRHRRTKLCAAASSGTVRPSRAVTPPSRPPRAVRRERRARVRASNWASSMTASECDCGVGAGSVGVRRDQRGGPVCTRAGEIKSRHGGGTEHRVNYVGEYVFSGAIGAATPPGTALRAAFARQPMGAGPDGDLSPGVARQLDHDVGDVALRRLARDAQPIGDGAVGLALGQTRLHESKHRTGRYPWEPPAVMMWHPIVVASVAERTDTGSTSGRAAPGQGLRVGVARWGSTDPAWSRSVFPTHRVLHHQRGGRHSVGPCPTGFRKTRVGDG